MINSDLSTELNVLLICLSDFVGNNQNTELPIAPDFDWVKFQELLKVHSVHLPVYHSLLFRANKLIPNQYKQRILKIQNISRKRNINLFHETLKVISTAQESGLNILPYKGLSFAKQFYGNIFQRSSVDIDFALSIDNFQAIKEVMLSLGYEEYKSKINHDKIQNSRAFYIDYPFIKKNENDQIIFNVEFHWTPSHQILNIPISFDEFHEQTIDLKFKEKSLKTFNKVHQALFAIIHHGNVDCWGKLKHLVDFSLILNSLNEREENELERLCKKYKVYHSLQTGKGFLGAVFNDSRYQHIKVSRKWTKDIVHGSLSGKWSENKMKFWYYLSSRDSFTDKINAALSIIKYQAFIKSKFD